MQKTFRNRKFLISMLSLVLMFFAISAVFAQWSSEEYWVTDPNSCPNEFNGISNAPDLVCGIDFAGEDVNFYDPSLISIPAGDVTDVWNSNPASTATGGYYMDCYDMDGGADPWCDNGGAWECNRDLDCYNDNRTTTCEGGLAASSTCGVCRTNYTFCDGSINDGCEINIDNSNCDAVSGGFDQNNNVSGSCGCVCDTNWLDCDDDDDAAFGGPDLNTGTGNCETQINTDDANHVRNLDCSTTQCEVDYLDCNGDGTGFSDGECEIHDGGVCVTPYGEAGTIMGCSGNEANCVADVVFFQTGTEANYATTTPLLWGTQWGTGPLMKLSSAIATSGVFFIENDGRVGIGTSTDLGLDSMLTVGMATGSQFIVNDMGKVVAGSWEATIIGVDFGGTGTSTWVANSLVYADSDNHLDELRIGGEGQVLSISSGAPSWENSAAVAHGVLSSIHSDVDPQGVPSRGDLMVGSSTSVWNKLALGTNGYILHSDGTDAEWIDYTNIFSSHLDATTTDALDQGLTNLYWSDARFNTQFDNRLSATSSIDGLTTLDNLVTVGTITTGAWEADIIGVEFGGTGTTSLAWTGLAYVDSGVWSATNTLSATRLDSFVMLEGEDLGLLDNTTTNYITLAQSRLGLTSSAAGLDYNTGTGEFTLDGTYEIPYIASTTNWNNTYNTVSSDSVTWDTAYGWGNHATYGYFSTTSAQILDVIYGGTGTTTEFTPGSIVFAGTNGIYTEDNGNFFWDDMNSRLGIGTSTPGNTLSIEGIMDIDGTILPNGSSTIGASSNRFQDGYFANLDVTNMTVGGTSISGTIGNSFTINSDNTTADLEDSSMVFGRGTENPDARILWDSSEDVLMFNFPIGLEDAGVLRFYEDSGSGQNYAGLQASTTMGTDLTWTLPTTVGSTGDSLMLDTAGNMIWANTGEILGGEIGNIPYYDSVGNTLTATSSIFLATDTRVGIGTSSPLAQLDIYGNLMLSGVDRYINFSNSAGDPGYGIWDDAGVIKVKSEGGAWTSIGAGATSLSDLNDVNTTGIGLGDLIYYNGTSWEDISTSSLNTLLSDTKGTLDVNRGGTGLSSTPSYGELLLGNSSNGYTLVSTSSLGLAELDDPGNQGDISFFGADGRTLTATSVIYINTSTGFVGMATTTPGKQLTVDGSGQFNELCFADGSCISDWSSAADLTGTASAGQVAIWDGGSSITGSSTLQANVGGTGKSDWTPLSIPYLQGTTTFGEITMGTSTYLLAVNATNDGYEWVEASSTGVVLSQEEVDTYVDALINDPQSTHTRISITYDDADNAMDFVVDNNLNNYDWTNIGTGHLTNAKGGTGWDSSASTGIAVLDVGAWSASTTLGNNYLDSSVMIEGDGLNLLSNTVTNFIDLGDLSSTETGLTYNNTNGQFSITAGYEISSTASTTNWNDTYNLITLNSSNWDTAYNWGNHSTYGYFSTTSAQVLEIQYGGTGTTTWEQNSLVYASADDVLSEVLAGTNGQILKSENGVPTWVATSSLGIDFSDVGGMLDNDQGGTGTSSATWTGFAFINGGIWSASNTIASSKLDSSVMVEGENVGLLNNDAGYITLAQSRAGIDTDSADGLDYNNTSGAITVNGSYMIPLTASSTDWQSTYLTVSTKESDWDTAYGWGDHSTYGYFSTTSAQVLEVVYGGTGTTTFEQNSLLYAVSDDTISEILAGGDGLILQSNSGVPTWVSTTSLGIDLDDITGILDVAQGGTGSSTPSGILIGDNAGNIFSVKDNTADWNTAFAILTASSTNWEDTYLTVNTDSSNWDYAYSVVFASTTEWDAGYDWANEMYNTIGLGSLTTGEVNQLENINSVTISNGQWTYLSDLDQSLTVADSPTFSGITINGSMAIGTTTPLNELSLWGDLLLEGPNRYFNFGTTTDVGTAGYGFRDNNGQIQYKNVAGTWSNLSALGVSSLAGLVDTSLGGLAYGDVLMYDGTDWVDTATSSLGLLSSTTYQNLNTNYLTKWDGNGLIDSIIYDNGSSVGIGTSTPEKELHVVGEMLADGGIYVSNDIDSDALVAKVASGNFGIATAWPNIMVMGGNGGGTNGWQMGSGEAGISAKYGLTNAISFHASSSEVMRITGDGFVGIGTTTPLAKLDVYGDMLLSGPNRYINFGTSTATSSLGYGFRDASGEVQYKNVNGSWSNLSALGVSNIVDLTDTSVAGRGYGDLLMYDGTNWIDRATSTLGLMGTDLVSSLTNGFVTKWNGSTFANAIMYDDGANVGIGTTTPGAKLHVVSATGDQLRLGYDQDNFADFNVNSNGQMGIDTADWDISATGGMTNIDSIYNADASLTLGTTGSGDEHVQIQAASGIVRLNASTQNYLQIYDSTGADYLQLTHDGTNASISTNAGEINIGAGGSDVILSAGVNIVGEGDFEIIGDSSSRIITIGDTGKSNDDTVLIDASNWSVDSSGNIALRSGGALRLYNTANTNFVGFVASTTADDTTWVLPASDGTAGQAMITNGTGRMTWSAVGEGTVASGTTGWIPYYAGYGNTLTPTNAIFVDATGRIGVGTSAPAYLMDVYGDDTNDYLMSIYNASSTALAGGGLNIRVDGEGALLNLNYAGTDVVTVTGAQTTFNNPVNFASVGDVSLAYDLVMANTTAGNIVFDGPGYLNTQSAWQDLDLTLSAANLGDVIVDDRFVTTGTTTLADLLYINYFTNKIGIGTSAPDSLLTIFQDSPTADQPLFQIGTSDDGSRFTVDEDGDVAIDGSLNILGSTTMAVWNNVIVVDGLRYAQNSTGIQEAIDALPADGGKIFLPAGYYSMTATTTIPSNVWIEGAGASSTILRLADGANSTVFQNADTTNGNEHIKISNLKIDGNAAGNSGVCSGILFDGVSYAEINSIYVYEVEDRGIYLRDGSQYNRIVDSIFNSNNHGIFIYESDYNVIANNVSNSNNNRGVYLYDADYNNVIANNISNNSEHGIILYYQANNNVISDNVLYNNSGVSSNYDGIRVDNNSNSNIVSNNRIVDTAGSGYAINILSANCDNNVVNGNQYSGTGAESINDSGTNTTFNQPERIVLRTTVTTSPVDYSAFSAFATTTATLVDVRQFGTGDLMNVFDGETEVFTIEDGGNVGIGTANPNYMLSIRGGDFVLTEDDSDTNYAVRMYADNSQGMLYIYRGATAQHRIEGGNAGVIFNDQGQPDTDFRIESDTEGYMFFVDSSANGIGIGTSSPLAALDVYGDISISGPNRYLNFGTSTLVGSAGYGFRDNSGVMEYKNDGGTWTTIGSAGAGGALGSMSDITITGETYGDVLMFDGDEWVNQATGTLGLLSEDVTKQLTTNYLGRWDGSAFIDSVIYDDGTNIGIGTSTPVYGLDIFGSGNLFRIATSGGDVLTVTESQITSHVPHSFEGAGNLSMSGDLYFSGTNGANITSYGALDITSGDPGTDTNLYLEGRGAGQVYIDDAMTVTGSTTMAVWNNVISVDGNTYSQDSTGIQAAIDALPAGGGKVFLPAGTYNMTTTTTIPSNVWIEGAGASSTLLQLADNANSTVFVNAGNDEENIKISNIAIDGNSSGNSGVCHGVYMNSVINIEISDVYMNDIEDEGVYMGQGERIIVKDNVFVVTSGIVFESIGYSDVSDNTIITTGSAPGIVGVDLEVSSVENNKIVDADLGILLINQFGNKISGNFIETTNFEGILMILDGGNNIISENRIFDTSSSSIAIMGDQINNTIANNNIGFYSRSAIYVNAENTLITGNSISEANEPFYAISVSPSSLDTVISSNLYDISTTGIDDQGVNTTFNQPERIALRTTSGIPSVDYSAISANATTTASLIDLRQFGSGDIMNIFDGETEVFTILDGGYVGIGDTNPTYQLGIRGEFNQGIEIESINDYDAIVRFSNPNERIWNIGLMPTILDGTPSDFVIYDETSAEFRMLIDSSGYVGIGTTSPLASLDVYGDISISGANRYMNFGTSTVVGASGYGFRDNLGVMEYKNVGGSWAGIGSAGAGGALGSMADITITGAAYGDVLMFDGDEWINQATGTLGLLSEDVTKQLTTNYLGRWDGSAFIDSVIYDDGTNIGIGTSTPVYGLDIFGSGNLFRIATSGGDVLTVTEAQITSHVPHAFTGSGDVTVGNDIYLNNPTQSIISSLGPLSVISGNPGTDNNLYLEGRGDGDVYVDDSMTVTGTTTMAVWNNVISVDGVTYAQNSTGIQAAIDALPAGGGKVFLPAGTYSMTATTTIPSNVWIDGAGASSTILRLADNANATVFQNADTTNGNEHIKISNLKIEGNNANNAGECHGVYLDNVDYSEISSVYLNDVEDYSIYLYDSNDILVRDNIIENTNYAIFVVGNSAVEDIVISGNNIKNSNYGVIFNWFVHISQITGNAISGTSYYGVGINNDNCDNNIISNNTIHDTNRYGIQVLGNNNVINSNNFNDIGSNGDYDAIRVASGADNNVITNNIIYDMEGSGSPIGIEAGATNNSISGNNYSGTGSDRGIDDLGTNTSFNQPERIALRTTATTSPVDYSAISADATTTATLVNLKQFGSGDIMNIFDGETEVFTILDGGNVGIGTSNPVIGTLVVDATVGATNGIALDTHDGDSFRIFGSSGEKIHLTRTGDATKGITIDNNGNIGIGTTSPLSMLDVFGNFSISGASRYINFGTSTVVGASGYGFRDDNGTMQYKNSEGAWTNIGSAGSGGALGSMDDVDTTGATYGSVMMYDSGTWIDMATSSLGLMGNDIIDRMTASYVPRWDGTSFIDSLIYDDGTNVGIGSSSVMSKLTVMSDTGSQLRLAYDDTNYVDFTVNSNGEFTIEGSGTSGSLLWLGDDTSEDIGMILDGNIEDFWLGIDDTDEAFHIGTSTTIGSSTLFTILSNGNVGIGTTSPTYNLEVNGSLYATDIYTSSSTFYMDGNPVLSNNTGLRLYNAGGFYAGFKASTTQTSNIDFYMPGADGTAGQVITTDGNGNLYFATADGTSDVWTQNGNDVYIDTGGVAIGTSTNNHLFDLYDADTDDYLAYIYNASTTAVNGGGLNIRVNGEGNILNLNHNGTDVMTVTGAQTTFNNPVNFASAGDVSLAQDLVMANVDSGSMLFNGPGYIRTNSGWRNLDLTLSAANLGDVIVDDTFVTTGTTTLADLLYINAFTGNIGIGTSSPLALLSIQGTDGTDILNIASSTGESLFYIGEDGKIGLNTMSPDSSMTILTSGSSDGISIIGPSNSGSGSGDARISLYEDPASPTGAQLLYNSTTNSLVFRMGTDSSLNNRMVLTQSGNLGIGTTSPTNKFSLYDNDTNDYLGYIYNASSTAANGGGLNIRVNGEGNILNLNHDGTDVVTVTGAQTTFNNPVSFASVGDVSLANDLVMANGSAGNILFDGPGYVRTDSAWENLDITFQAANLGDVIVDDSFVVTGTTTLEGNMSVASGTYIGFDPSYASSTYGIRDYGGTLQYKNNGSQWVNIGSAGSGGALGSMADVSISGAVSGEMIYYNGSSWANSGIITLDDVNSYVGIGTSSPSNKFTLLDGDNDDYLAYIYNASTTAVNGGGLNIRVNGEGNILNLNHNGTDVVTVTGAQTTFNNPVSFGSVGDVSLAQDLVLTNGTAGNIIFDGPGYVKTESAWQNLNLTLSAANDGNVVVDDAILITGTTTIKNTSVTDNSDVFVIATSSSGSIMRVTGYGDLRIDGSFYSPSSLQSGSADYAEYFYTTDTDLVSGETVCVDITHENAVKRCDREADSNVMGIVSTNPAIVGNSSNNTQDNENYVIVGMLGQVPARVSTENGEIRPGDSLTSASSTAGFAMKANAGDPTVGVALEGIDGEDGVINVLISRKNKSLTVETVESQITDRIANMEIEDEVALMLATAIDDYNIASSVVEIVDEQTAVFDTLLTVEIDSVSGQITNIASAVDVLTNRMNTVEAEVNGIGLQVLGMDSQIIEMNNRLNGIADISTTTSNGSLVITDEGNIRMGPGAIRNIETGSSTASTTLDYDVAIVDITTVEETELTALVVNQIGSGDVADFQSDGVSIVNIAQGGEVSIVGEMMVDGRIMVCSGGVCGSEMDELVDETMGDIGVEGKVVAGAFESICASGYVWVEGNAKYGTMPGFCVSETEARYADDAVSSTTIPVITNISQGEAKLACIEEGGHLITENEWMTIAENIITVSDNDADVEENGLQLATIDTSTSTVSSSTDSITNILANGNEIYDFVGGVSEWTDQTVTQAGLVEPVSNDWNEYIDVNDYKGFNIAPPYYYTNGDNGIGRIKTGENENNLRAFVRGTSALFDLDLSHSPVDTSEDVGYRCAK